MLSVEERKKSSGCVEMEEGAVVYRPVARWETDEVVSWLKGKVLAVITTAEGWRKGFPDTNSRF